MPWMAATSAVREDSNQFIRQLEQAPARLTGEQVAGVLNCQPSDVWILVAARLLKPLGNPPANGVKFFATVELLELVKDRAWLARVTNALNKHWQRKNKAKKPCADGNDNGGLLPYHLSRNDSD